MGTHSISDSSSFLPVSDSVHEGAKEASSCSYIETMICIGVVVHRSLGGGKLSQPYLASLPCFDQLDRRLVFRGMQSYSNFTKIPLQWSPLRCSVGRLYLYLDPIYQHGQLPEPQP